MRKFLWLLLAIIACSCKTTGTLTGQYYADNSNATFNLQKDSSFTFHWSGGCVMKDEATGYYTFKNNVVTFYYGPAKIDTTKALQ